MNKKNIEKYLAKRIYYSAEVINMSDIVIEKILNKFPSLEVFNHNRNNTIKINSITHVFALDDDYYIVVHDRNPTYYYVADQLNQLFFIINNLI